MPRSVLRWPSARGPRSRATPRPMALAARPVAALSAEKEALADALARALYAELRGKQDATVTPAMGNNRSDAEEDRR